MTTVNQHDKQAQAPSFKRAVRLALLGLEMDVGTFAKKLRRPRTTVSTAINHPTKFPHVKALIKRRLELP